MKSERVIENQRNLELDAILGPETLACHLEIMQGIIQRMASNSASCKTWAITIVSALLAVVADKRGAEYALIATIPTTLFLFLDAYYLCLEKGIRNVYNRFNDKLHKGILSREDFYTVAPEGYSMSLFFQALCSLSVWPFYMTLIFMILLTKVYVL